MNLLLAATANQFGLKHIIILVICIAVITAIAILFKKIKFETWINILFYVGIFSESTKLISYILMNEDIYSGYLPKTDLPFQLCSIQLIFIAILKLSKNEKLKRILLSFMMPTCLIGGSLALILPTYSSLNAWSITFQYFIYHVMIVAFAIYLLSSKEFEWTTKDWTTALKFLAFMGLIAIYLNSMFFEVSSTTLNAEGGIESVTYLSRVNFMYIIDPPAKGLPFLNKDHGWFVYIIHFACTAVISISLCYIKPIIKAIREKKGTQDNN